jgi:hypothetical protein
MSLSCLGDVALLFGDMCDNTVNIVWEMIPPLEYAGSEFMLYIPDVQSAYLEVLGMYEMSYTFVTFSVPYIVMNEYFSILTTYFVPNVSVFNSCSTSPSL